MRHTIPHYYREFSCAADRCTDTLAAMYGEIMIDPVSEKVPKTKGPLGNRLNNSIRDQGSFKQYGGAPSRADSGLQRICPTAGRCFCKTCRTHSRTSRSSRGSGDFPVYLPLHSGGWKLGRREPACFLGF